MDSKKMKDSFLMAMSCAFGFAKTGFMVVAACSMVFMVFLSFQSYLGSLSNVQALVTQSQKCVSDSRVLIGQVKTLGEELNASKSKDAQAIYKKFFTK